MELSNPSRKVVSYAARLEGHSDFTLESQTIRLEPGSKAMCEVKCTPTSGVAQQSRLVLTSKRDGTVYAATLVFALHSAVDTRSPLKRVKVEKALYELKQFEFSVTNPFPADCDFSISLLHETSDPNEDGGDKRDADRSTPKRALPVRALASHSYATTCV